MHRLGLEVRNQAIPSMPFLAQEGAQEGAILSSGVNYGSKLTRGDAIDYEAILTRLLAQIGWSNCRMSS